MFGDSSPQIRVIFKTGPNLSHVWGKKLSGRQAQKKKPSLHAFATEVMWSSKENIRQKEYSQPENFSRVRSNYTCKIYLT